MSFRFDRVYGQSLVFVPVVIPISALPILVAVSLKDVSAARNYRLLGLELGVGETFLFWLLSGDTLGQGLLIFFVS